MITQLLNYSRLHLIVLVWIANHCTKKDPVIQWLKHCRHLFLTLLAVQARCSGGLGHSPDIYKEFVLYSLGTLLSPRNFISSAAGLWKRKQSQDYTLIILEMYQKVCRYLLFQGENLVGQPCLAARYAGKYSLAFLCGHKSITMEEGQDLISSTLSLLLCKIICDNMLSVKFIWIKSKVFM